MVVHSFNSSRSILSVTQPLIFILIFSLLSPSSIAARKKKDRPPPPSVPLVDATSRCRRNLVLLASGILVGGILFYWFNSRTSNDDAKLAGTVTGTAVPTNFVWKKAAIDTFSGEDLKFMVETIKDATRLVAKFPPPNEKHLFMEKGFDSITAEGVNILLTTSEDPLMERLQRQAGPANQALPSTDAFTVRIGIREHPDSVLMFLLLDRLFYERGSVRRDIGPRAAVVLAHEIYGNVTPILQMNLNNPRHQLIEARRERERHAFESGIAFIERVRASPTWNQLPEEQRQQFLNLLEEENRLLAGWR